MTDRPTEDEIVELGARAIAMEAPESWAHLDDEIREQYRDDVRAALAEVRAAGMVVVPAEPTEAMIRSAMRLRQKLSESHLAQPRDSEVYRAMIAAALPAPPATGGEG